MQNMKSNIIIRSNLYPCKEEWTIDSEFMGNIFDYHKINNARGNKYSSYLPNFKQLQMSILGTGKRCVFAKNDPCMGYIKGNGTQCRCIKKDCPNISKCNPNLTEEYYEFWTTSGDDEDLYGNPAEQKKYYLVDLVSDEEKNSYFSSPETDAHMYPIEEDVKKQNERTKIIIGYTRECFNDYCDEQLSPIYGYADTFVKNEKPKYGSSKAFFINFHENNKKQEPVENKYKSFNEFSKAVSSVSEEDINSISTPGDETVSQEQIVSEIGTISDEKCVQNENIPVQNEIAESPRIVIEDYASCWKRMLNSCNNKKKILLQEITNQLLDELINISVSDRVTIVFLHEGELGYASNMLSKMNIKHTKGTDITEKVVLKCISQLSIKDKDSFLLISKSIFNEKYLEEYNSLIEVDYINSSYGILEMRSKSFSKITSSSGECRWLMSGVYGATHIEIKHSDIELFSINDDVEISMVDNLNEEYDIIDVATGSIIGKSKKSFIDNLNDMLFSGVIFGLPDEVQNLKVKKYQNDFYLLGLGHMVFAGY